MESTIHNRIWLLVLVLVLAGAGAGTGAFLLLVPLTLLPKGTDLGLWVIA